MELETYHDFLTFLKKHQLSEIDVIGTDIYNNYLIAKLIQSIKNNDFNFFQKNISYIDVDSQEGILLKTACEYGDIIFTKFLIYQGAISSIDESLIICAENNKIMNLSFLLMHGAKIKLSHYELYKKAIQKGHKEILLYLEKYYQNPLTNQEINDNLLTISNRVSFYLLNKDGDPTLINNFYDILQYYFIEKKIPIMNNNFQHFKKNPHLVKNFLSFLKNKNPNYLLSVPNLCRLIHEESQYLDKLILKEKLNKKINFLLKQQFIKKI